MLKQDKSVVQKKPSPEGASKDPAIITFQNNTDHFLLLASLVRGRWVHPPPAIIHPRQQVNWSSAPDSFAKGTLKYWLGGLGKQIRIHWDKDSHNKYKQVAPLGFKIIRNGNSNTYVIFRLQKA